MKKTAIRKVDQPVIAELHCNKCCANQVWDSVLGAFTGIDVNYIGGYHSVFPGDDTFLNFSLCETCLRDLCETFKIPVTIEDM